MAASASPRVRSRRSISFYIRALAAGGVSITLASTVLVAAAPGAELDGPARQAATPTVPDVPVELQLDEPATVTLITGDRVTVHPGGLVETGPGPGRDHVTFDEQVLDDQIRVVPSDAAGLLAAGRLDERLFDLTYLIREGYDDASRDDLPLITEGEPARLRTTLRSATLTRSWPALDLSALTQDKDDVGQLWSSIAGSAMAPSSLAAGVEKVWLDGTVRVALDESVPQIGAPAVWESGFTGDGVTVAVLDTGVDANHPDLAGRVVANEVFAQNPPDRGVFTVEGVDFPVQFFPMAGALPVPRQGVSDLLVHVGRACVASEGDTLAADPAGRTALIARGTCPFAEKYDAAVQAGATAVVFYNDAPGLVTGTVAGAEHEGTVWAAGITDLAGAALRDVLAGGAKRRLALHGDVPGDLYGHGTHVAATIAGTGAASDGARRGVAPDARIMNGKVCDDGGGCQDSWVLAGMEWAARNGADVVNMSLSGLPTDGTDPLSQAVNTLTDTYDVLFVIAAGNQGTLGQWMVGTPGTADAALTVGAVDKADQLAPFSSMGPRKGDHAAKPEVTAPGVGIVAARAGGTRMGTVIDDAYTSANGTSMATPHVAGAAALLAHARPDLDAGMLKNALTSTAADGGYRWFEQGAGRLDIPRAITQGIYADAAVSLGILDADGGAVARTVTFTNDTRSTAILQLDGVVTDQFGREVAQLTLPRTRLIVRAGDTASVPVTIDPNLLGLRAGTYGATITATGRDISTRTVVGFAIERDIVPLPDTWQEDWTRTVAFSGPNLNVAVNGAELSPDGEQIFLFGIKRQHAADSAIIVMAVDADTGDKIWSTETPVTYASYGPAPGLAVAEDSSAIFVTLNVHEPQREQVDILTVAYNNAPPRQPGDPGVGEQLWQASHDAISPFRNAQPGGIHRIAVTPDGQTVLVLATQVEPVDGDRCLPPLSSCATSILTIAYDAATGERNWIARHKGATTKLDWAGDLAISPAGDLAYVSGTTPLNDGRDVIVTIAYVIDGENAGVARWTTEHEPHLAVNSRGTQSTVSADGRRIFVTSSVTVNESPPDLRMQTTALDATTGARLWTATLTGGESGFGPGHTTVDREHKGGIAASPNNDLVFITGQHCEGGTCTGAHALVTAAYDQTTGEQRWVQIHESVSIPGRLDRATPRGVSAATSPDGTRLYIAGACCWTTELPERSDQVTLAYEAVTGDLIAAARHRYDTERINEGLRVLVAPDGDAIFTIGTSWRSGVQDIWGLSAYSPPTLNRRR